MKNTKGGGAPRLKKIYIRTMNSDKQSIKNQGGGEPKPYQPSDEGNEGNNSPQNPPNPQGQSSNNPGGDSMNQKQNNNSPGMPGSSGMPNPPSKGGNQLGKPGSQNNAGQGGPANIPSPPGADDDFQKNFQESKQGGSPNSEQGSGMPGSEQPPTSMGGDQPPSQPPKDFSQDDLSGDEYPPKKSNKKLFIILLIIILALGAAVAVYFLFLSPSEPADNTAANQNQEEQTDQTDNTTAPATSTDDTDSSNDISVPTVPAATSSDDQATSTDDTTDQSPDSSVEVPAEHESLLSTPADTESAITLDSMNLSNFASALEFSPTEVPLFREVVLLDSNENIISFGDVAQMIAPTVFTDEIVNQFQDNATFVTYTNSDGTWLGLVATLGNDADSQSVQGQVATLEDNTSEVRNFFLSNPGSENSWQDGGAGDVSSRYITFENQGASFNYGWDGNTLIIGTSYSTFQQIVNHL